MDFWPSDSVKKIIPQQRLIFLRFYVASRKQEDASADLTATWLSTSLVFPFIHCTFLHIPSQLSENRAAVKTCFRCRFLINFSFDFWSISKSNIFIQASFLISRNDFVHVFRKFFWFISSADFCFSCGFVYNRLVAIAREPKKKWISASHTGWIIVFQEFGGLS